jgi:hypothetical protein
MANQNLGKGAKTLLIEEIAAILKYKNAGMQATVNIPLL